MFDIDEFKKINDTYGHDVGDKILQEVGRLFKERVREEDCASRFGGDEFRIGLVGVNDEQAFKTAESLRKAVEGLRISIEGQKPFSITASFGIASINKDDTGNLDLAGATKRADIALYGAKRGGRNRVVSWTKSADGERPGHQYELDL